MLILHLTGAFLSETIKILIGISWKKFLCVMISGIMSCQNLITFLTVWNVSVNGLLDLLVPLKKLRARQRDCPWLSNTSLTKACCLRDVAH